MSTRTVTGIATIERLSHEGRGVAKINGKTTFIENALPTEEVSFNYLKRRSKYDEGVVETVLKASPERVEPKCPHFLICGGCSLQHLKSDSQIQFKQATLLEQFQHFGQVIPQTLLPPLTGPTYAYRRKARLGVRFVVKKDRMLVGFREKNGRYIADISSCAVLEPTVSCLIEPLKNDLMKLAAYREIAQIEVAIGDDETALIFRNLQPLSASDQNLLIEFGQQHQVSIYLQPGNPKTTYRIWPTAGEERLVYRFPAHDIELKFHPLDFVQVNAEINRKMVDRVIDLFELKPEDNILDLFCGLGNFTMPLARYCHSVVGIEGDSEMVIRAQENAQHNQLNNTAFFKHDLTQPFSELAWAKKTYHKILLDPPRSGAAEILADIARLKPQRLVYISCNPATLARDTHELVHQHGFKLLSAGVMDMFPQTCHVESIAVFES